MSLEFPLSPMAEVRAMIAAGHVDEAMLNLRGHLAAHPDDFQALRLVIETAFQTIPPGKPNWTIHARRAVAELAETGDMTEESAARMGRVLVLRREMIAARALGAWLERRFPDGALAALFLFDLHRRVGEPAMAFAALARAAAAHPLDPAINLAMAERLIATGRAAEALPHAVRLKGLDTSGRALLALARARIAVAEPSAVPWLARQAQKNGDVRPSDLAAVVRDLTGRNELKLADELVEALLEAAPSATELLRAKVEVLTAQGREADAIDTLQRLVAMTSHRGDIEALFDRLIAVGLIAAATLLLEDTERLFPRSIAVNVMRSKLFEAMGLGERARQLADRTVRRMVRSASTPVRRRSVVLAGVIGSHGLGDFIYQLLALASMKRQFDDARLTLFYNNELTYKTELLRFCPDLDEVRDYAGGAISLPVATKDWTGFEQTILLTQSSLSPTLLAGLDRTATFVTPPHDVDGYTAALRARGLDPDRWFVAIHYRQNSLFGAGGGVSRDVDAEPFHHLAAWICGQGGQVVRLGHPGMPPIPEQAGYVDLSDGGLSLQLFAVSKARFMVGCDSGPSGYATAFKTPLFKTNTFSEDGAAYAGDLILPKNMVTPWNEVLSIGGALDQRLVFYKTLVDEGGGVRFVDNSFEQLRHGAQMMLDRQPLEGWRQPAAPDTTQPPNAIVWPRTNARRAQLLDVVHLLGLPVHVVDHQDMIIVAQ